jgi:hypothetical protein
VFDWRQRKRVGEGWGPQARCRSRALLGVLIGMALLALPLAAEEAAKAAPDEGLQARGQAFWEARIKEDYATQYGLLEPKVRRQLSLTNYIQAQGPCSIWRPASRGCRSTRPKASLRCAPGSESNTRCSTARPKRRSSTKNG